ncbi:hypothetical protein V2W30_22545 [Streptomyces sp. Q6]|uniref:Uncharacterized protein n=1 Tax=Streptomyces citrinus TaxID=3118173 RepID=A0ACD5AF25_9ACTN
MTRTLTLTLLYLLGAGLAVHASVTSGQHDALGYALGFAALHALLLVAAIREWLAAEERRAIAAGAARLARLRARAEAEAEAIDGIARIELAAACCEMWWTSAGADHDAACGRDRWAA